MAAMAWYAATFGFPVDDGDVLHAQPFQFRSRGKPSGTGAKNDDVMRLHGVILPSAMAITRALQ